MNGKPGPNRFHDINKFPKEWGLIVFPISMSRIGNAQSAQKCIEALSFLAEKISTNRVGAHFIYGEAVYMNLKGDAWKTKNNYAKSSVEHMRGVKKLVAKNYKKFQIDSAFSFASWFQMYLAHPSFFQVYKAVQDLYKSDREFRKYVARDAKEHGKRLDARQLAFYLEEHALAYLMLNRQFEISNKFVNHQEQWILYVYPGRPPRGQIYLCQKDPLQLNKDENPYKGQYDLETKLFIDYQNVDLKTY